MSEQPMLISAGQAPSIEPPTGTSVWTARAGRYAAVAVANAERAHRTLVERRLDQPSRSWTAREVVRSYRRTADGDGRYQDEADVMALHGYRSWLGTARPGHPRGGRILLDLSFGGSSDTSGRRASRSRTVTWTKESTT